MYPFFAMTLRFQQAGFRALASAGAMMMKTYMRVIHQQFSYLDHLHAYRRPDDPPSVSVRSKTRLKKGASKKKALPPCHGPDLKHHYGKRAHDVDVEHI